MGLPEPTLNILLGKRWAPRRLLCGFCALLAGIAAVVGLANRAPGICGAEQFGERLVWGRWSSEASAPDDLVDRAPCP